MPLTVNRQLIGAILQRRVDSLLLSTPAVKRCSIWLCSAETHSYIKLKLTQAAAV